MKSDKLKEVSERLGLKLKIDKSLDNYSKVDLFPNKTKKAREIVSKTRIKFC
ncbi:hypothetical protein [Pararcticibacter amylolyticus]|uniref:hypothetical protein n=1 Tax=Pararcticibacter amylolyticus TaxID=2173175 RepID=UPI001EE4BD9C|nr:hypothetical protein [Pararcticibacter amylolyticus]